MRGFLHATASELQIAQESAWQVVHRTSEIWDPDNALFGGCADVTQLGGRRKNMPNHFRNELAGSRPTDKTAVVGARDRATNQVAARAVESTAKETLQGFVESILADCPLDRCDGQWVPCHLLVSRQEFETLFLGLNEEQCVEWVFVFEGCVEFSCGVSDGDW